MYFKANSITRGTWFLFNGTPVVTALRLVGLTPHGKGWLPQLLELGAEKFRLISPLPAMPNCFSGWFRKLNTENRSSILWCSLKAKSLYIARSLLKNAGPLMYGQIRFPFCPLVAGVKHAGLKYWPELRFLRGSQISRGMVVANEFVPK